MFKNPCKYRGFLRLGLDKIVILCYHAFTFDAAGNKEFEAFAAVDMTMFLGPLRAHPASQHADGVLVLFKGTLHISG
jgi:hypothetical protein